MSKIYIKQSSSNYLVYAEQDEPPILKGHWYRKKGLHSIFFNPDGEKLLEIRIGKYPWIGGPTSYLIDIKDQPTIEVILKSRWRIHFDFHINEEYYVLYEHIGHKKSLYRNGRQVAKFDKAVFNWGERDSGFAIFNSDENLYVILGLWIMKDMGEFNDAEVSADFGNVVPGPMEWNEYWLPTK